MATVSKRIRKERRRRRNASLTTHNLRKAILEGSQHLAILLAILAARGGDTIVPQSVIDQVGEKLPRLGYAITAGKEDGTFLVTMVEQTDALAS